MTPGSEVTMVTQGSISAPSGAKHSERHEFKMNHDVRPPGVRRGLCVINPALRALATEADR